MYVVTRRAENGAAGLIAHELVPSLESFSIRCVACTLSRSYDKMSEALKNSQTEQNDSILSSRPWIRHYEEGVPAELAIPDHPLTWLLDRTVSRYPDHTAFIYYGTKLSYAQFNSLANRFASGLQRLGVKKGDRIAIALPNIPQYPIAFYGALRAGTVIVPTN